MPLLSWIAILFLWNSALAGTYSNNSVTLIQLRVNSNAITALRIAPRTYVEASFCDSKYSAVPVAFHLKGNYGTFQAIEGKPSLTLHFAKSRPSNDLLQFEKLHLNNSASDPTLMTEVLCHDLFSKADLPALRTDHARVEVNGRALGLYVRVEGYGKRFLKDHFAVARGNLYDSEFRHDITEPLRRSSGKDQNDRSDLVRLAKAGQEPNPMLRIDELKAVLNLNQFYSFLALELMSCHFDGYARSINNYWLYHDLQSDKFIFLPYGMDQMFWNPESSLFPELEGIVARAVLGTVEGRSQYRERCKGLFPLFPSLTNRIEELYAKLRPEFAKDGTNAVAQFDRAVQELRDRVNKRIAHLRKHLFAPEAVLVDLKLNDQSLVTNWLWSIEEGATKMTEVPGSTFNVQGLESKAPPPNVLRAGFEPSQKSSIATWEKRLLLPKGTYLIVTRTACNEPVFRGPKTPVGLKVWGGADLGAETVRIDAQHLDLLHPLRIDAEQEEILLQCQLQNAGQAVTYEVSPVVIRRLE